VKLEIAGDLPGEKDTKRGFSSAAEIITAIAHRSW
jgi:hypothetical protein